MGWTVMFSLFSLCKKTKYVQVANFNTFNNSLSDWDLLLEFSNQKLKNLSSTKNGSLLKAKAKILKVLLEWVKGVLEIKTIIICTYIPSIKHKSSHESIDLFIGTYSTYAEESMPSVVCLLRKRKLYLLGYIICTHIHIQSEHSCLTNSADRSAVLFIVICKRELPLKRRIHQVLIRRTRLEEPQQDWVERSSKRGTIQPTFFNNQYIFDRDLKTARSTKGEKGSL